MIRYKKIQIAVMAMIDQLKTIVKKGIANSYAKIEKEIRAIYLLQRILLQIKKRRSKYFSGVVVLYFT